MEVIAEIEGDFIIQDAGESGWFVGCKTDLGNAYLHSDGSWRELLCVATETGEVYSGYYPDRASAEKQLSQSVAGSIASIVSRIINREAKHS